MNQDVFFAIVTRSVFGGRMMSEQKDGISKMLDFAAEKYPALSAPALAYVLATATWETGRKMRPCEEAGWLPRRVQMAYLRTKRYFPWYGRGLPQVTWKANYEKFGVANPDDMLSWPVALDVMFRGMTKGMFSGRRLDQYISSTKTDFVGARWVINEQDKAQPIAAIAEAYLHALGMAQDLKRTA